MTIFASGCAQNRGGHCALKASGKDGRIIRVTTDNRPYSAVGPQLRGCPPWPAACPIRALQFADLRELEAPQSVTGPNRAA